MPKADAVQLIQPPTEYGDANSTICVPELQSALSVAELDRRPSRPPDYAAENRALIALARQLAVSPDDILQTLVESALTLCSAHSAGISLLEADGKRFYWPAIAGRWLEHLGGGTPREYGPCGTVLDRNAALLFSHPERDFDYFAPVTPLVEEALLMPFYINDTAVGTIWVIAHDQTRRFESEDLRLMTNLGTFAASAYQVLRALNSTQVTASIVASSEDAIVTKDLNGIITSWNSGAEHIFGYSSEDAVGNPIKILIPADRLNEESAILDRVRRGQRVEHYDTVRVRKDGSLIDISLAVSPVKNLLGKVVGASKIARDITARKRAETELSILAREAEHRTKNVLATVQATVQLTEAQSTAEMKAAIQGRIQALANVHSLFIELRWAGAKLHDLITQELDPYRRATDTRVRIEGHNHLLEPNTAQSVAIIFHELATNAAKHGALSVPGGRVEIVWSRGTDGRILLCWKETDGPPVVPPTHRGFGTRVMASVIRQGNAEMRLDWPLEGLVCEVTI